MLGLGPREVWGYTPSELNVYAREFRRRQTKKQQDARYETSILASFIYNAAGPKVARSPDTIYRKMPIKDPDEQEEVQGPRRVYKGTLKSQFEQHIKFLEEEKGTDASNQ